MSEDIPGVHAHAVSRWLVTLGHQVAAPLRFQRIGLGQANLTYRVTDAAGRAWVLRHPPLGHLLASAHDVVREARIMPRWPRPTCRFPGSSELQRIRSFPRRHWC